jgi:hypothetical protein
MEGVIISPLTGKRGYDHVLKYGKLPNRVSVIEVAGDEVVGRRGNTEVVLSKKEQSRRAAAEAVEEARQVALRFKRMETKIKCAKMSDKRTEQVKGSAGATVGGVAARSSKRQAPQQGGPTAKKQAVQKGANPPKGTKKGELPTLSLSLTTRSKARTHVPRVVDRDDEDEEEEVPNGRGSARREHQLPSRANRGAGGGGGGGGDDDDDDDNDDDNDDDDNDGDEEGNEEEEDEGHEDGGEEDEDNGGGDGSGDEHDSISDHSSDEGGGQQGAGGNAAQGAPQHQKQFTEIGLGISVEGPTKDKHLMTVMLEGWEINVPKNMNLQQLRDTAIAMFRRMLLAQGIGRERLRVLFSLGTVQGKAVQDTLARTAKVPRECQEGCWPGFHYMSGYPEILSAKALKVPAAMVAFLTGQGFELEDLMPNGMPITTLADVQHAIRLFAALEQTIFGEGVGRPMTQLLDFIGPQEYQAGVPAFAIIWFVKQIIGQYFETSRYSHVRLPAPVLLGTLMWCCGSPRNHPLVVQAMQGPGMQLANVFYIEHGNTEFKDRYLRMATAAQPQNSTPSPPTQRGGVDKKEDLSGGSNGGQGNSDKREGGGRGAGGNSAGAGNKKGVCYKFLANKLLKGQACDNKCGRPHEGLDDKAVLKQFVKHPMAKNLAAKDADVKVALEALATS